MDLYFCCVVERQSVARQAWFGMGSTAYWPRDLGRFLNIAGPQFLCLQSRDDSSHTGLFRGSSDINAHSSLAAVDASTFRGPFLGSCSLTLEWGLSAWALVPRGHLVI